MPSAEKYLVNRLPAEAAGSDTAGMAPAPRYELMHDHLVQILGEAPDPVLQKARDAQERLHFWLGRTKLIFEPEADGKPRSLRSRMGSLFAQPIPLMETLRLWRFARSDDERWMLKRNLGRFGLRMALVALLLMPGILFAGWYQHQQRVLADRNMGELVVHNVVGAKLTLTCIHPYGEEHTCPAGEIPLQGQSMYLEGPADYMLTAQKGWTVQYPVYIQGYTHQVAVTVTPPPDKIPDGMVYIPGGVFRMGDKDGKDGMGYAK